MKKRFLLLICLIAYKIIPAQNLETGFHSPLPIRAAVINKILTQPDGKYLLGGGLNFYGTQRVKGLVRLNTDGSIDNTFSLSVSEDLFVVDIELQSTGDIVVLTQSTTNSSNSSVYQFDTNGLLKNKVEVDVFYFSSSLTIQSDDKVLVCGSKSLLRYNSDLTTDENFNNTISFNNSVTDVQQSGNSLIVSGTFSTVNGITKNDLVKLDMSGNIDNSFDTGTGTSDRIGAISIQADGKILLGNSYIQSSFNGTYEHGTCRLNQDGSVDNSFSTFYLYGAVSRIFLSGSDMYTVSYLTNNSPTLSLFKLSVDGSIDHSFAPVQLGQHLNPFSPTVSASPSGFVINNSQNSGNVFGVAKFDQTGTKIDGFAPEVARFGTFTNGSYFNNKLLVGGDFVRVDGFETYGVASINMDGTVDQGFALASYLGAVVQLKALSDGNVLVSTGPSFVKLNSSGIIQPGFSWSHFKKIYNITKFSVLDNGKIVVADANDLYRLNADGSEDTSFDIGTGISGTMGSSSFDFDMQSTKVIYGAMFDHFNGTPAAAIVRLNENASPDLTFNVGTGPDGSSFQGSAPSTSMIKILDTNEVLVGGDFLSFNGVDVPHGLVKLSADGVMDLTFNNNQKLGSGQGAGLYLLSNTVQQIGSKVVIGHRGTSVVYVINLDGTQDMNFQIPAQVGLFNDFIPYASSGLSNIEAFALGSFTIGAQADPASLVKLSIISNGLADQAIIFNSLSTKTFGDATFDLTAAANSGLSITYTSSDESVATITNSKVTIVGVGSTVITAHQTGDATHNPATDVPQTLIVNKADQFITFNSLSVKNFSDADFDLTAVATSDLPVNYTSSNESVATIINSKVTIVGVGTTVITAHQTGDATHNPATDVPQTLIVNKADQFITFNSLSVKTFSDAAFDLTAIATSDLSITYTSSDESVATITNSKVTIVGVGSTVITAHQTGDATHNPATDVPQTLIVNKADQFITFNSLSVKNFSDADFDLTAVATSDLPVNYTSSNESVVTIINSKVNIVGVGSTVIIAHQAGDATHNPATDVSQSLIVNKADQTITFSNLSAYKLGDMPFLLSATSSSGLAIQFTTASDKVSINGNQVSIVKAGNLTIQANQSGNGFYNGASPVNQSFCVNPAKPAITSSQNNSGSIQLTSSVDAGNHWYLDGTLIQDAVENKFIPTKNGSYSLKVSVDNCTSEFSDTFIFSVTGLEEPTFTNLVLYPNPTSSVLHVDLSAFSESEEVDISIYDGVGNRVETTRGQKALEIGTNVYSEGIYFLVASQRGKVLSGKFIKK